MIVVTAPTGHIGGHLVNALLETGSPIRVVVRDPARLAPHVAANVEVVTGSHADPAVVPKAFAGADAVFFLVAADPQASSVDSAFLGFARAAIDVFAAHEVGRVVGISALGRGTPVAGRAGHVTATLKVDDLIAATGVPYRALTMPSFMDNTLRQVSSIRSEGVFAGPITPDLRAPLVATRDIAAVAATWLLDDAWTGFAEVPVLGAADVTHLEMAETMSSVLGFEVRYRQVTGAELEVVRPGMSAAMVRAMADMSAAKNLGLDNGAVRTPASTTPTTFRQWCADVLKPAVSG
ncbi:NAD(P)H-binding protein [Dactylosporangium matsuzakiense]|uniref:NmrA family transcriptional regulator n=1 Tax=Dactylosporangium matsuzakiense TaxID=53360 RepID=A0A9W6KPY2_9ACTN|nr:NAD(P)H-binding protein [Dactylosporangium matsuzakiense]UWZ47403.1 NAD(P)H-binding protein [Dactylosporangium matsuzakiense]GLL05148.1 NmrA family transcriptional regulator [Dactylosporangium matsuzakiense]